MSQTHPDSMLIVYNAEDGFFNAVNDWAHKFFSPSTYECPLCRYTYGMTGMLMPWKTFIEGLPFPTRFLYRPYFKKEYPQYVDIALPLILVENGGELDVLVLADEIKDTGGLNSLVALVQSRLDAWQPPPKGSGESNAPNNQP